METFLDIRSSSPAPATTPVESKQRKRILVVDDDPAVRTEMVGALDGAGHQVETAADGEAAWQMLLAHAYDLVVTDHLMPKVSGLALARRIRVAHLPLLVILTSEKLEGADTLNLSRDPWSRIDSLIHKPFTSAQLLAAVRSLLPDPETTPMPPEDQMFGPPFYLPSASAA